MTHEEGAQEYTLRQRMVPRLVTGRLVSLSRSDLDRSLAAPAPAAAQAIAGNSSETAHAVATFDFY